MHRRWTTDLRVVAALTALLTMTACHEPSAPRSRPTITTTTPPTTTVATAPTEAPLEFVELVTGNARRDARLPLILAIHGLGDNPRSFIRVFQNLTFPARVLALRGLDPFPESDGYAWFPMRTERPDLTSFSEGVRRAVRRIAGSVPQYLQRRPTCGRPVVTGFSQGGILSFALAVERPDLFEAAIPLAGMLVPPMRPTAPAPAVRPWVSALHGDADVRISVSDDRETVASLRAAGFEVTLREFPDVGHTIDDAMLAYLSDELGRATRSACRQ